MKWLEKFKTDVLLFFWWSCTISTLKMKIFRRLKEEKEHDLKGKVSHQLYSPLPLYKMDKMHILTHHYILMCDFVYVCSCTGKGYFMIHTKIRVVCFGGTNQITMPHTPIISINSSTPLPLVTRCMIYLASCQNRGILTKINEWILYEKVIFMGRHPFMKDFYMEM